MPRLSRPQPGQLALFDQVDEPPVTTLTPPRMDRAGDDPTMGRAGDDPTADGDPIAQPAAPVNAPTWPLTQPSIDVPIQSLASAQATYAEASPLATPPQARRAASQPRTEAPRHVPSRSVTLDQVIPVYLTALAAQGRSQHTLKSFELDLRMLRGQLGNRTLGSIDLHHLRQFIAWVRLTRENTPNSLRRKVATLKNFFGYLHDEGYLPANIADALPYPEAFVPLPEFLEDEAVARLLAAADGNPFWRALLLVMIDTGLKRDEVLALRLADLYLDDVDDAPETDKAAPAQSYLVVRETDAAKRLRSRKLPLSPRLCASLREYLATAPPRGGDARLFDVSVRGINFIVETCGARAGIVTSKPRLTPQVLRETFAVAQMRARVRNERLRRAEGWREEALQLLFLRHDAEVLELLGLKEDPITARKYRQLVRA